MLRNDKWIRKQCIHPARLHLENYGDCSENEMHTSPEGGMSIVPMITPFSPKQVREDSSGKIVSYGTSSMGYDIRTGSEWQALNERSNLTLDPKECNAKAFRPTMISGSYVIPPRSFVLCRTPEYFHIPRDTLVVCLGKSTYARLGLVVNVTPLEPEWEGNLVIELSNTSDLPIRVYANEGIAQLLFLQSEECETSYKDRAGKYQGQTGITLSRV